MTAGGTNLVALGATHWNWRPDVNREVQAALTRFSAFSANTYKDHPWPGWDGVSADFWGPAGRGDPLPRDSGWPLVRFLLRRPGQPLLRHIIYEHSIWTSWGGWSVWTPDDHSRKLRHAHFTWWK